MQKVCRLKKESKDKNYFFHIIKSILIVCREFNVRDTDECECVAALCLEDQQF